MTTTTAKRVTARPTTTNVLKAFWRATTAEFSEGRAWYSDARKLAEELARSQYLGSFEDWQTYEEAHEAAVRKAVAVIAVLSPRLSWSKNVELARLAYQAHAEAAGRQDCIGAAIDSWPGLKDGARKAFRILGGEKPENVVSGPKVTAFYYAITDAADPRGIVIDRHAFDVAVGRVMDDKTRGIVLGRAGAYEQFVRAYERAAQSLRTLYPNITPAEVQAITWIVWRNLKKAGKI